MVFNAISFGNHVSFLTEIVSFPMLMFITIVSFLLESDMLTKHSIYDGKLAQAITPYFTL